MLGWGRREREVVCTAPCQAQIASLAKKLSEFFQSGLYNAVTLCKEGGWSVPRTLASWHCHSQGTTNAGPFGKLQFGLTQYCHKTFCNPSPVMLIAMFYFSVAYLCSHYLLNNKMWWLFPGCRGKVHYTPSVSSQASGDTASVAK